MPLNEASPWEQGEEPGSGYLLAEGGSCCLSAPQHSGGMWMTLTCTFPSLLLQHCGCGCSLYIYIYIYTDRNIIEKEKKRKSSMIPVDEGGHLQG